MPVFILELGTITLQKLQEEPEDEIYIIGGVMVKKKDGTPVPAKTKFFASSNVTVFKAGDINVARSLNPQGEAYNEELDDDEIAVCQITVVEHDAASTVKDITGELEEFLESGAIGEISGLPNVDVAKKLARILSEFTNTISNILDEDDIIGQWKKTYRMKSIVADMKKNNKSIWRHDITFPAEMDEGLYDPVTATAYVVKS